MRGWPWTRKHGFYPPGWPLFLAAGLCVYVVTRRASDPMDGVVFGAAALLVLGGLYREVKKRRGG